MTWTGNPRTTTPEWRRTRRRILQRDQHRCQQVHNGQRCNAPANQVDHIINHANGGTDDDHNLQTLCEPHHKTKTATEANTARWQHNPRRRTPEPHPGLRH